MKKNIIISILALSSILSAGNLSTTQQQIKDMALKVELPILKVTTEIRKCSVSKNKESYISCMQDVKKEFKQTEFANIFENDNDNNEIDLTLWNNEKSIKELDESINQIHQSIQCINNPETTDIMSCMASNLS